MKIEAFTLSNGIRFVFVPTRSDVGYCGVVVNTGTRDEDEHESGYAHLVEHCLFKGTRSRTDLQIIDRMESVGGEMNAYTTKELTALHAAFLKSYLERSLELLSDMLFESTFSSQALKKEVPVVMDEIDSYLDSPADSICDDYEDLLFAGSPLGRNILGSKQSLRKVTSKQLLAFYQRTYTTDQMVFFCMGPYTLAKVQSLAARYLECRPATTRSYQRVCPPPLQAIRKELRKHTSQVHWVTGTRVDSLYSEERYAFSLLNMVLGGDNMNSRLNLSLREKHSLVYTVGSQCARYTDTGNWNIYLACDANDLPKAEALCYNEMQQLIETKLTASQLKQARRQLAAQWILAGEHQENWLLSVAKNYMRRNALPDANAMREHLAAITTHQLQDLAQRYFKKDCLLTLIYR